jgi:hypothetical protein
MARISEPRIAGGGRCGRSEPGVGAGARVYGCSVHTPAPVLGEGLTRRYLRILSRPGIAVLVIEVLVIGERVVAILRLAIP